MSIYLKRDPFFSTGTLRAELIGRLLGGNGSLREPELVVNIISLNPSRFTPALSLYLFNNLQVDETTTLDSIHCSCDHLSAFGGQLFVAPNPIDFDKVFTEFTRLPESGNVAVTVAVGCVFGLYLLLLLWARKFDKLDRLKVNTNLFILTVG